MVSLINSFPAISFPTPIELLNLKTINVLLVFPSFLETNILFYTIDLLQRFKLLILYSGLQFFRSQMLNKDCHSDVKN